LSRGALAAGLVAAVVVTSAAVDSVTTTPRIAAAATAVGFGRKIKHVVVIYQENHSFDETLGRLCEDLSGRCDGHTGPVRLKGGRVVAMRQSPDVVPNVWHDVHTQQTAMDGGAMDGWAQISGCHPNLRYACLTYYTPAQIPNLAALASKFVVSDRTFSMRDSPSWGGHVYAAAATQDHFTGDLPVPARGVHPRGGWGCDSNRVARWRDPKTHRVTLEPSCIPARPGTLDPRRYPFRGAFRTTRAAWVPTIFDRLDANHRSWKLYSTAYEWSICPSFAECRYGAQRHRVVTTHDFLTDVRANRLPSFSILLPNGPNGGTSQHNGTSMRAGDNWIGKAVKTLMHSPDWSSTAVFITYDDCGCFYDHVPPGKNPDGTIQGIRVPMVIVSPYARRGYTDSHPATFASILRFTEEAFGLDSLSVNDRRAYDYRDAFDFTARPIGARATLRQHSLSAATKKYLAAHPPTADDPT
jgi:phospholipase C